MEALSAGVTETLPRRLVETDPALFAERVATVAERRLLEREDGERRRVEVTTTPATLNGEPQYLGILRDVTERRRTERRLRAIVERIDQAIYLTRADEITEPTIRSHDLSAGYEQIRGQSLEAVFENSEDGFFDTLHPDERAEFEAFVRRIGRDIEDGTAPDRYSREYRIERPDGEIRWIRSEFYPTEWDTGPLRIVIVSRDVTGRKARERRIASFDDATDDLATADTPEEATVVVEVPTQADTRSFVERLGEIAPSLELVAQRHHQGRDEHLSNSATKSGRNSRTAGPRSSGPPCRRATSSGPANTTAARSPSVSISPSPRSTSTAGSPNARPSACSSTPTRENG